jgi:hypothetical protein
MEANQLTTNVFLISHKNTTDLTEIQRDYDFSSVHPVATHIPAGI